MEVTETPRKQYYDHSNYTATYYALYIALERWLASVAFRNDLSRVFLASPDYAYRRRFELTDTTTDYSQLPISSLRFPFANYWPLNDGWVPDTRIAANPASLVEIGMSAQTRMLQAIMVTMDVELLLHFDREDDARQAYELLLWQSYREQYTSTTIAWKGETLQIPLNIKVQNLQFNPDFTEKDWLSSNRIFIVQATLQLRSFSLKPPRQLDYNALDGSSLPDDDKFYLTDEVILSFMNDKKITKVLSVRALFDYNIDIPINYARVAYATESTVKIEWDVGIELSEVIITREGTEAIHLPGDSKSYIFNELIKNSSYTTTIAFITESGSSKEIALTIETSAGTEEVERSTGTLIGTTW
jgi:hypothetical protein